MKHLASIITFLILLSSTHAWTQGMKLKNRSSFRSVDSLRNPFWPIGYTPGSPEAPTSVAQVAPPKASVKPEDFNLTSISSFQGARMAMLSGKAVGEGQLITLNLGGQRTKVQIISVSDGSVTLRCMGQEITVPLKRPELDLMSKPAVQEPRLNSSED